jgi:hypothetical protein
VPEVDPHLKEPDLANYALQGLQIRLQLQDIALFVSAKSRFPELEHDYVLYHPSTSEKSDAGPEIITFCQDPACIESPIGNKFLRNF